MKGFVCSICGFISIDGAAPEICPVCHAPKKAFSEKEDALKTVKDKALSGESEKKHIPYILIEKKCSLIPDGCIDANIKIGEITHPMLPEHYILHIDLYVDRKFIMRASLTPEKLNPAIGIHLKVNGGKLSAVETCNLHGSWINEIDL